MKPIYDIEEILYRLYDSLLSKYDTIVVVFKSQKEKNKDKTFRILQEMKNSLKNNIELDLYARRPQNTRNKSTF